MSKIISYRRTKYDQYLTPDIAFIKFRKQRPINRCNRYKKDKNGGLHISYTEQRMMHLYQKSLFQNRLTQLFTCSSIYEMLP